MTEIKNILQIPFFIILLTNSLGANSQTIKVYLKNTGNETVYVAFGYHTSSFLSSSNRFKGWAELKPGQKDFYFSLGTTNEASFAFAKRGGNVVYKPKSGSSSKIGVDEFYVDPVNGFDYKTLSTTSPNSSYVLVKTSFKIAQGYCWNCSGQTLYQTIEVPSYTSDQVLPFSKSIWKF